MSQPLFQQMGTHSRDWRQSLGADGYALAPADRQARHHVVASGEGSFRAHFARVDVHDLPLKLGRWLRLPATFPIHECADGSLPNALRQRLRTHARSLTGRSRFLHCRSFTRGLQTVRIELEPAKQSADPFHCVTPFDCVGFNTVTDSERQISGVQEPFAFGARNE